MHTAMRLALLGRRPGAPPQRRPGRARLPIAWLTAAAAIGILARFLAATQGHNYDVESYWIVAGHVDAGENVYASTHRYNYGPAWFLVLGAIRQVADLFPDPFVALRFLVVAVLTAVDLAITAMLLGRFGRPAAALFLLHPVSVLITGYHSQFDNLAIGLGLAGMLLLERADRRGERGLGGSWGAGVAVLGVSLVVKHLLVVLPLWLALRQRSASRSALMLIGPPLLLALSFVPFAAEGWEGILENVIGYRSAGNAPFLTWLLPPIVQRHVSPLMLFGGAMLLLGWIWRRQPPVALLLLYTVAVTVLTPGMYWQYLAIPAAATVVFANVGYLIYVAVATAFLLASPVNVGIPGLAELLPGFLVRGETGDLPYGYLLGLLALGLVITAIERHRLTGPEEPEP